MEEKYVVICAVLGAAVELQRKWRRFFNTSGIWYREMNLKEKLGIMSEDEQLALLASDSMLVKRPIAVSGDAVLVGFNADKWAALK